MKKERGLLQVYHPKRGTTISADVVFVHGLFGDRQQTWTKDIGRHQWTPDPNLDPSSQPQKDRPSSWRRLFARKKNAIRRDCEASSEEGIVNEDIVNEDIVNEDIQQRTSSRFEVFWPRNLLPRRFPDFRIFTWGYDVDIDHVFSGTSTATVFQHAANLLSDLSDVRTSSEAELRPLFFVAHSLGGIVVKDALNQSLNALTHQKAIAPSTAGVCFLGTPHRGASVAALGETIYRISKLWGKSPNLRVLQALKYDAETLDRVQSSFNLTLLDARCKINIRSFREAEKHHGVTVVDRFSSIIGNPNEIVSDIQANHRNMTKFSQPDEPGFLGICNALDRWMKDLSSTRSEYNAAVLQHDFLESLENSERRNRVDQVGKPYEGTFTWLFDPQVGFRGWLSGPQQAGTPIFFWIQGKPGSGKSTVMKYALAQKETRELLALANPGNWHLIPFFFHDRGSSIQRSVTGLLQELLYRLVEANEKLLAFIPSRLIYQLFKRRKTATQVSMLQQRYDQKNQPDCVYQESSSTKTWSVHDLQEALIAITGQNEVPLNVLFFVDALDEYEGNYRDLIRVIQNSFLSMGPSTVNVKFCLASRPYPAFTNAFGSCPGLLVHEHTRDDVQRYARQRIASSIQCGDIDQDVPEMHQLAVEITQRANGVFIWVRIVVEELIERFVDGCTISQLRNILSAMPEELEDLYRRTLSKVKPEYELESYIMTQIVLHAKTPRTLKSLLEATDIALQRKVELMSRATMGRRLESRCGGLLEGTSTSNQVQFLHQTVKTFFAHRHHATSVFRHPEDSPAENGSYYMLKYCIYIATRLPSAELDESWKTLLYLFDYAAESLTAPISEVMELLECLVQKPRRCASFPWEIPDAIHITEDGLHRFCSYTAKNSSFSYDADCSSDRYHDLSGVSLSYGLLSYTQHKTPHRLPPTPPGGRPLLHAAIGYANPAWLPHTTFLKAPKSVDWLLQKGADPNERREGDTALALALVLTRRSRNPPPVFWLVIHKIIRTLLMGGADPSMASIDRGGGPSPVLCYAIDTLIMDDYKENNMEIVRILLEYKADCNEIDFKGYRPLYYAIEYDLWQVAELLLQHGANPSDLGNGINALRSESFHHDRGFYKSAMQMQALLRQYSTRSERSSRRSSVNAEDASPSSHVVGELHEMESTGATEDEEFN